jgi:hypothetical protein
MWPFHPVLTPEAAARLGKLNRASALSLAPLVASIT